MRTSTAAGGSPPAGKPSTMTRTTFEQPPLWLYPVEEINLRASNQYATDNSSFWKMKVLQTKSMQTLIFNPGGFKGLLCACPFLGTWRALLCGEVLVLERLVAIWSVFLQKKGLGISVSGARYKPPVCIVIDCYFLRSQAGLNMSCRAMGAGGMNGCERAPWSEELDGKELHGAAGGDLEPREPAVSSTSSPWSTRLLPYLSVVLC